MQDVGKYQVQYFDTVSYDKNGVPYAMIIFVQFDKDDHEVDKKVYYFSCGPRCIIPHFQSEEEIEAVLKYKQYSKLKVTWKMTVEEGGM